MFLYKIVRFEDIGFGNRLGQEKWTLAWLLAVH